MHESDYVCGTRGRTDANLPVVLSGCSGGGKSTILSELFHRGYRIQPEPGRQIVREQMAIRADGLPWENIDRFLDLTLSRAMHFYNTAPNDGPLFVDRSVLDCATAYEHRFGRLPAHVGDAVELYRYHHDVFMVPPWEDVFTADEERKHSFSDAVAEYERLVPFYETHGYRVLHVPIGAVGDRADFIEHHLSRA